MLRRFSRRVAIGALAFVLAPFAVSCSSQRDTGTTGDATDTPLQPPSGSTGSTDSSLTVGTTEGPYYVTGTAELKDGNLNAENLPGEPIRVTGYVYSGGGTETPIASARVEIWHADSSGAYHPNSNGAASQYSASELKLRGYVVTDANGRYEFTSIYPGHYPGRTRHIHVRASANGFGGVATQIIVPAKSGDNDTPATDTIAQSLPTSYQVQFTETNGVLGTTFDFHLGAD